MNEELKQTYDTVDQVIAKLKIVSDAGKGQYPGSCQSEYWLSDKKKMPRVDDKNEDVDFI